MGSLSQCAPRYLSGHFARLGVDALSGKRGLWQGVALDLGCDVGLIDGPPAGQVAPLVPLVFGLGWV